MNFNIYLGKNTGEAVNRAAKNLHRSRNSIIAEALDEWLDRHVLKKWPKGFFDFEPVVETPDFKDYRKELKHPEEDPLA